MFAASSSDSDSYSSTSSSSHDSEPRPRPIPNIDRPIRPRITRIRSRPIVATSEESDEESDIVINFPAPQENNTAIRQRPQTETEESEEGSDIVINFLAPQGNETAIRQRPQTEIAGSGEDSDVDLPPQQRNGQSQQQHHQNHNAEHLFPALENLAIQQHNNSSFRPLP